MILDLLLPIRDIKSGKQTSGEQASETQNLPKIDKSLKTSCEFDLKIKMMRLDIGYAWFGSRD